ncbi:hypothetical protein GGH99_005634, partial [Coemansia sp. RSA 1285]
MQTRKDDDLSHYNGDAASRTKDGIDNVLIKRFEQRPDCQPYTNIGDRLLIALNPNETLDLASDERALQYIDDYRDTSVTRENLPPHVFRQRRLVTRFLSLIRAHSKKDSRLYARIQNADIVLEAFTHAKTAVHNNGSRLGSYMEIQFDNRGRTVGAKTLTYLLEKSR